jgi:chromosome segregation ATPase
MPTRRQNSSFDPADDLLKFEEAPEFQDNRAVQHSSHTQDVDSEVREAQKRLADLRIQQEEIEKQKNILENRKIKQEQFTQGRRELLDRYEKILNYIAEEKNEIQRRFELMESVEADFDQYFQYIKGILPEHWQRHQLDQELDRAVDALEQSAKVYESGFRKLQQSLGQDQPLPNLPITTAHHQQTHRQESSAHSLFAANDTFKIWCWRGFAFLTPLLITLLLILIIATFLF